MSDKEWQTVIEKDYEKLEKLEVLGGALYRSTQYDPDYEQTTESMTFVPSVLFVQAKVQNEY